MVRYLFAATLLVLSVGRPLAASALQSASPLAGTNWVLREYAVQRSALVPAVGEQRPTLMFGTDGQVSGATGCNSFTGPYSETGGQLTIGPVVSTLRACLDGAVARQEQLMLRFMNGNALATTQEGSRLILNAPAGMLVFLKADTQNEPPGSPPSRLPTTGGLPLTWPSMLLPATLAIGLGLRLRLRARCLD